MPTIATKMINVPQRATPKEMLVVGQLIYRNYIGQNALNWPAGTDLQRVATDQLYSAGFMEVTWAQPSDFCLWLGLGFTTDRVEKWIIEYMGDDIVTIGVYDLILSAEEEVT